MEGSPRETDFLSGRKSRGSLSRSGRFRDVRRSLSGDPRHLSGINVRKQFSSMVVKKKLKNSRPNIDHVFSKDYVVKFGSVRDWSFRSSELSNQGSVIHEVDESSEAECEKKDIIPNDLEYMEPNDAVDINALVQSRSIMLNENLHEEKTNASWINSMRNLDEIHSSMNHSVDSELPSSIQNLVLKAKNIVCNLISRESYLLSDDGTNQLQILSEILNCILPEKNKQLNNPDRIDLEQLVSSKEIKNNASEVIQDENLKLSSKTIKFEKFKIDVYRNSESVNSLDKSASLLPYRASSSRSGSITSYKRTSIESDGSSPKRSSINNIFRLSRTHIINSLDSSCTDVCIPEETERSTQPSGPRLVRSFSDSSILDLEFSSNKGPKILSCLLKSSRWDFDIFEFGSLCENKPLQVLSQYLFQYYKIPSKYNIRDENIMNFFATLESSYLPVAYHNNFHAADVLQSFHFYCESNEFNRLLLHEDIFAGIIAAAIHDVGHPGNNNNFEVNSKSPLAVTYNDRSVLENFHLATAFRILQRSECNIFSELPSKLQRDLRENIITMVLATDMQQHTSLLARLRDSIAHKRSRNEWFSSSNIEDRKFLLSIAIHLADISSASKKTYVSLEWAIRVHDEFWKQGDLEREKQIAVSAVMDRNKPNFQKSQIGFINFIVDPLVKLFVQVVPQVEACIVQQNVNLSYWKARISVLEEIRNGKHDRDHRS